MNGVVVDLSTEQAENATLISAIAVRRGMPARAASIALQPSGGDVDLAAWGPLTRSVLESGSARKRDVRGLSERLGTRRERLRVKNPARKGAYFYVEASVGAGGGSAARKVAGLKYGLAVSIVKAPKAARR